jgi:hypothetical protein
MCGCANEKAGKNRHFKIHVSCLYSLFLHPYKGDKVRRSENYPFVFDFGLSTPAPLTRGIK